MKNRYFKIENNLTKELSEKYKNLEITVYVYKII